MVQPYHYIRFGWFIEVELEKVAEDLDGEFNVGMVVLPRDEMGLSLHKEERGDLEVSADTLTAWLSAFRAVLFQKEAAPFTTRDMDLRNEIFELYPRGRPNPFPWSFVKEPKFERVPE